jgi:hypothetical protein
MTPNDSQQKKPLTFLDKQANTPLSIWGLSALCKENGRMIEKDRHFDRGLSFV